MSDLVAWLRAELDEDERTAKAATSGGPWREVGMSVRGSTRMNGTDVLVVKHTWPQESAHMIRHDPVHVLAEVEAKRQILVLHQVMGGREGMTDRGPGCQECSWPNGYSEQGGWCRTVRLLALPYAGRPGYDEAWKP